MLHEYISNKGAPKVPSVEGKGREGPVVPHAFVNVLSIAMCDLDTSLAFPPLHPANHTLVIFSGR